MLAAFFKFLTAMAKGAGEAALKGGKLVAKTALKPFENIYKEGLAKGVVKTAIESTPIDELYNAFKSITAPKTAEAGGMGEVPIAPTDYYKSPQAQIQQPNFQSRPMASDMGILGMLSPDTTSQNQGQVGQPRPSTIPSNIQQFVREPSLQFVPGPEGSVMGGQGEVMQGYGMSSPSARIPPAYLQYAQQQRQPTTTPPGFFAGLKEGALGIPSSAEQIPEGMPGRQTAYYAGKLIPDIVRSRLGVSTTGEEARQQQILESYGAKKVTPEYKKDLQEAITRLANPNLSEADKIMIYQQLVTVYPERSAEIKRIFFPQSGDNFDDVLKGIIAGHMYER